MNIHGLDTFFDPRRIALIGVTMNPNSVGGKVLTNLIAGGFRGVVYPVNAESEAVMGIPCYPSLEALPRTPDLAVICTGAEKAPDLVRQCGDAGIRGIIILSAGFKETGEAGRALERQVEECRVSYPGMRIIGPNCLGLLVPSKNLNISFAGGMPKAGNIAFISQSGALCTSVLDWALSAQVGFSHFVSIGNTMDVDFGDLIDYFGADSNTHSIILYIESISRARRFMTAARAFARTKPILAFKAGRFPESAQVASSHTGALAAEDDVYDAAFQRVGLARVYELGDIFDCVELIGRNKLPRGARLGIVTNAGGPGVIATDALIAANGTLARLSDDTLAQLNDSLPTAWSHRNPVDVLGDANSKRVDKAAQLVLADSAVDALLVILTPQAMTNVPAVAKAVGKLAATTSKPILAAWLGGLAMGEGTRILVEHGVPAYETPEQAVRAFMILVDYSRNLQTLYETPKDVPVEFELDRATTRAQFTERYFSGGGIISEHISKKLVEAYGIPVTRAYPAANFEQALVIAHDLRYPVVMKIFSPDITHKTDVGGVMLGIEDDTMLQASFERMMAVVRAKAPDARIEGVTIQSMINPKGGLELILGVKKDATFGTIIMIGAGGITAELLRDRSLGFPPLNERLARRMLESLRIWPLLQGYRGRPGANIDKLIEVLIRLSYLAADYPEIAELDINPLLVTPQDVVALDARICLASGNTPTEPYAHLALRPYPEGYVKKVALKDGTEVTFRPIKPEDEPMWLELLGSCSKESLYQRFRYFFHWQSHDVATRFCYIDYDREVAIVAEINEDGKRKLLGIGRLIADPGHEEVEYAVLISDAWQKRELGSLLTDYCMEIAQRWNLKRIVAQTTTDNRPMISVFEKRGFAITYSEGSAVDAVKSLV